MDPALYLTEEENAVIGEWAAESVEELLGDGPQTSMEGVDNINDALRLDFKSDRNVTVIYKGEEIGTFPWSVALGYCSIESENPSLTVMINDDGDSSGMLYLSPGIGDVIGVKDGKKALQTTVDGDLNMHPSGEWGISFWVNSDTQKIANQGGNLTAEPWILTGLNKDEERKGLFSMIDDVQITNSHIMVAGSMAVEDEGTKIVVYDYDGNQLLKLGGEDISSPDKLGSITGMAETENGFVAADGNMREIQFWAKDGTHVGAISTEDIFGVSYPWLEDMQLLDDGSLLIMLTQERDDGSANELMFFRLTGF